MVKAISPCSLRRAKTNPLHLLSEEGKAVLGIGFIYAESCSNPRNVTFQDGNRQLLARLTLKPGTVLFWDYVL